jgi:hypothetical protein
MSRSISRRVTRKPFGPAVGVLLIAALLIHCGGGTQGPQIPPPTEKGAPPPTPTILRVLHRVLYSGTDRMTCCGSLDSNSYPSEGQMYYVADQPGSNRDPLNRYVNAGATDHADGISPLDNYTLEEVLGYPWTQGSLPGLTLLSEGFNSSTGDYALMLPSESLPGYSASSLGVYGYPRFGNSSEVLLSLSAGGVTVESNEVAGGVTWRWYWNGMQFENHFGYGGEIQAAFYFGTSSALNPNEAGDGYAPAGISAGNGSPVVRFENHGNTQSTRAVPLNWDPTAFGGDIEHPIVWDTVILGKDVTLDFNNMGPVAQYTTHLVLPAAGFGTLAMPTGYLRGNFNRFWTYDAQAQRLTEVTGQVADGCSNGNLSFPFYTNYGGVIISDASGDYAMGVYGVSIEAGGQVSFFGLYSYPCMPGDTSENSWNFNVWTAVRGNGDILFPAGDSSYNSYVITETLQNVTKLMDNLYSAGIH